MAKKEPVYGEAVFGETEYKGVTLEQKVEALIKEVMRLLQLRGDALEISNLKKALGEE